MNSEGPDPQVTPRCLHHFRIWLDIEGSEGTTHYENKWSICQRGRVASIPASTRTQTSDKSWASWSTRVVGKLQRYLLVLLNSPGAPPAICNSYVNSAKGILQFRAKMSTGAHSLFRLHTEVHDILGFGVLDPVLEESTNNKSLVNYLGMSTERRQIQYYRYKLRSF